MLPTNAVSKRSWFLAVPHLQWHSIGNQKGGECGGVTNESAFHSHQLGAHMWYVVNVFCVAP